MRISVKDAQAHDKASGNNLIASFFNIQIFTIYSENCAMDRKHKLKGVYIAYQF